jgi:hypothetical protein
MSLSDDRTALKERIHELETSLARALESERQVRKRAELLERTTTAAWRLSMMAPRRRNEPEP